MRPDLIFTRWNPTTKDMAISINPPARKLH